MQLNICEIFYSLQGEPTFTGLPCIFIRLSGCNLACTWCDTLYAKTTHPLMDFHAILKKIEAYHCNLVEITGGEPLMQKDTAAVISGLIEKGYQVLLETNGSISLEPIHHKCVKIVDVKGPSSGHPDSFLMDNLKFLSRDDELKFVIADKTDYQFAQSFIQAHLGAARPEKIHLSPVFGQVSPEDIAGWMLSDNLKARLSLQQHKIIWHPDQRGV